MKRTVTIFGFCLLAMSGFAQHGTVAATPVTDTVTTPPALGLTETDFDFGKIPQGRPVTHLFEVVNTGTDSLRINNVQASCGCTTPSWEQNKAVAPGEKTQITVGYNAATEGNFSKQISVTYNGSKTTQITIRGEVWKTPAASAPENKELAALKAL